MKDQKFAKNRNLSKRNAGLGFTTKKRKAETEEDIENPTRYPLPIQTNQTNQKQNEKHEKFDFNNNTLNSSFVKSSSTFNTVLSRSNLPSNTTFNPSFVKSVEKSRFVTPLKNNNFNINTNNTNNNPNSSQKKSRWDQTNK